MSMSAYVWKRGLFRAWVALSVISMVVSAAIHRPDRAIVAYLSAPAPPPADIRAAYLGNLAAAGAMTPAMIAEGVRRGVINDADRRTFEEAHALHQRVRLGFDPWAAQPFPVQEITAFAVTALIGSLTAFILGVIFLWVLRGFKTEKEIDG